MDILEQQQISPLPQESASRTELDIVDADKVEQYLEEKMIGDRIRRLRLKRSMGLVELGTRTGLSASFLSQLETGRVVPTIRNLAKLALVFEKDLSYFFRQEKNITFRHLRQTDRVRLNREVKGGARFVSESLSSLIPDHRMVPCLAEFLPGREQSTFSPKIFSGLEFLYVLQGELCLVTPTEREPLHTGDVVWIDARTKREYSSSAGSVAKALIVTFPKE